MSALHPLWHQFLDEGELLAQREPEKFTRAVELLAALNEPDLADETPLLTLAQDAVCARGVANDP